MGIKKITENHYFLKVARRKFKISRIYGENWHFFIKKFPRLITKKSLKNVKYITLKTGKKRMLS